MLPSVTSIPVDLGKTLSHKNDSKNSTGLETYLMLSTPRDRIVNLNAESEVGAGVRLNLVDAPVTSFVWLAASSSLCHLS